MALSSAQRCSEDFRQNVLSLLSLPHYIETSETVIHRRGLQSINRHGHSMAVFWTSVVRQKLRVAFSRKAQPLWFRLIQLDTAQTAPHRFSSIASRSDDELNIAVSVDCLARFLACSVID